MLIPAIVFGVALVMMVCEATRPGRTWPQVAGWWLRAALLNGIEVASVEGIHHSVHEFHVLSRHGLPRQTHGFEGLRWFSEGAEAQKLAVAELEHPTRW